MASILNQFLGARGQLQQQEQRQAQMDRAATLAPLQLQQQQGALQLGQAKLDRFMEDDNLRKVASRSYQLLQIPDEQAQNMQIGKYIQEIDAGGGNSEDMRELLATPFAQRQQTMGGDVQLGQMRGLINIPKGPRQMSELDRAKLELTERKIKSEEQKQLDRFAKAEQVRLDKEATATAQHDEAVSAISLVDGLIKDDKYESLFGSIRGMLPTGLPSSVDAEAELDLITALLSLESRQKLKGQGQISDKESKTLEKSATILSNTRISPERAKTELDRVRAIFKKAKEKAIRKMGSAPAQPQQPAAAKKPISEMSDDELLGL